MYCKQFKVGDAAVLAYLFAVFQLVSVERTCCLACQHTYSMFMSSFMACQCFLASLAPSRIVGRMCQLFVSVASNDQGIVV